MNPTIGVIAGIVILLVGMFMGIASKYRGAFFASVLAVLGAAMALSYAGASVGPLPPIPPVPPIPVPPVPPSPIEPVTAFGLSVRAAFVGTPDEARELGDEHKRWAKKVRFDGTRPTQEIKTLDGFYAGWNEWMRGHYAAEKPFGDRLDGMSRLVAGEMRTRGVPNGATLDSTTRAAAVGLWLEIGEALEGVK